MVLGLALLFFFGSFSPVQAKSYRVKKGEYLSLIAQRFGVSTGSLVVANKIRNSNLIYPGQFLVIPKQTKTVWQPKVVLASNQGGAIWIRVDLSEQKLSLFQGNQIIFSALVSTGTWRYPTPQGTFMVWGKFRFDDMQGGSKQQGDYYYLPKVPHAVYFYQDYAIHGTYWHQNFGRRMSHGCINLSQKDASYVYQQVGIGTPVVIRS